MPTTPDPIRARIEAFLTDIQALTRASAMEAVQAVLSGSPAKRVGRVARRAAPATKRVARKAGKRAKRTSEDVQAVASKVLAYVRANAGQRLEEIGRGLRVDTHGLKFPIQKLLAEKKLRTSGQKRGTKYFAGGRRAKATRRAPKAKPAMKSDPAMAERMEKMRAARAAKIATAQ